MNILAIDTVTDSISGFITSISEGVGEWGLKLIGGIAALIIGLWLVKLIMKAIRRGFDVRQIDVSLKPFLLTLISFMLKFLLFVTIAGIVGVPTASFAAVLAGVGIAIGAAFNGSLGHLASGVMILIFKPFRVGDLVELDGHLGTVKEISVFVTVLETFQNKTVIIPNGTITAGTILNLTRLGDIRVDMPFGIRYGADIQKAKSIVEDVLKNDPNVMDSKPARVAVNNLGENGVELLALPYAKCENYWDVYWDTRERIVERLGQEGFEAPLPQRIVTMHG